MEPVPLGSLCLPTLHITILGSFRLGNASVNVVVPLFGRCLDLQSAALYPKTKSKGRMGFFIA